MTSTVVRASRAAVGLGAGLYLVTYLVVAAVRIRYPYELEWIEGAMVDHVGRILSGRLLYVAPSLDFTPFIYAPFYFYVSALFAEITGLGFFALRLVSMLSSLGSLALLYAIVRRESGNRFAAFVSVGLFAATYRAAGAWFDVGRIDSLALVLVLSGAYLVRFGRSRSADVGAAVILTLAFHTKQSMVFIIAALALYVVFMRRQHAPRLLGTLAVLLGLSTAWLAAVHHGWYTYYVFDLPSQHAYMPSKFLGYWWDDTLRVLPVASLLALVFLAAQFFAGRKDAVTFYGLFGAGMVACSWMTRIHDGAWDNVLIPGFAAIALLAGLAIPLFQAARDSTRSGTVRKSEVLVYAGLVFQFSLLPYNPFHQVPTPGDRGANAAFVEELRGIPGDVLVLSHGYLSRLAGKPPHAHWQAIADVLRSADGPPRTGLREGIESALRAKQFGAVILNGRDPFLGEVDLEKYYRLRGARSSAGSWPITGARTRPELVFVPR